MKKLLVALVLISTILVSCGEKSKKKQGLDATLYQYASMIRWSNYDNAMRFLKPGIEKIKPSKFELEHLKQFKVSRYKESPITPGQAPNEINQSVEIQLYNIHTNAVRTIKDYQTWEYNEDAQRWFLTSGIPKI